MKRALPVLILSLVIAVALIVMAFIAKDRSPTQVYSIEPKEGSNEHKEPGDYVVKY